MHGKAVALATGRNDRQKKDHNPHTAQPMGELTPVEHAIGHCLHIGKNGCSRCGKAGNRLKICINKCRDLQRRNAVRRYTPLEDAEHIASPEDSETSELLAAVRSLPDKLHEVVVLHYLEGFSVEETARCLRISVSAVKMRLTRGRQAIKALLGTEE